MSYVCKVSINQTILQIKLFFFHKIFVNNLTEIRLLQRKSS